MRRAAQCLALAGLLGLVPLSGAVPRADAAPSMAGSCEFVSLRVQTINGVTSLATSSGGTCAFNESDLAGLRSGLGQTGRVDISSSTVLSTVGIICDGSAVRGVSGTVNFTVYDSLNTVVRSHTNVSFVLDGAPGSQTLNPTATVLMRTGLEFAGTGTFTRSGSGDCATGSATWSLGTLAFT